MKSYLLILAMAVAMSTSGAFAQTALNSASQAAANTQSQSGSMAQGGSVYITEPGSRTLRTTGTTTIRSAPQVVAPSMSSGHPCAWAPLSMGISVVGFGGALGGQRIDDACLLAQMGYKAPSISMIAARNPAACRALEANHMIRPGSCGGTIYRTQTVAYAKPVYPRAGQQAHIVQQGKQVAFVRPARPAPAAKCRWVTPATGKTKVKYCG